MLLKVPHPECQHCQSRYKSVLCELNDKELSEINSSKGCTTYKKGETIFHEGSIPHGLHCINSGKIKLVKLGEQGKEQVVHLAKDGDVLGYRSILSEENYSASAVCLEDSSICFIPKNVFTKMLDSNGGFSLKIMKELSAEVGEARKTMLNLAQKPVRERVAEALLFLKQTYGLEKDNQTLNVSLSREDLANIVGTATETVIRFLSEFKNDNLIELDGRKIKLLNLPKLSQTANLRD